MARGGDGVDDLGALPKFRDGLSYLYLEHCKVDREARSIAAYDKDGVTSVPCANLALLMLGPGVSITSAAVLVLADHGTLTIWVGEGGVRFYASGMGETRGSANLLRQASLWADEESRRAVARELYQARFGGSLSSELSMSQIRGMEGARVRDAYRAAAKEAGIEWSSRSYRRDDWRAASGANRALSVANSCLYGICHSAIVTAGFSPAIGFIHTSQMLSFVYDVADLYKTQISIPVAFSAAASSEGGLERRVRLAMRDKFVESHLLARIIPDIQKALGIERGFVSEDAARYDRDRGEPGRLWDDEGGEVEGGRLYLDSDAEGAGDDGSDS